MFETDLLSCVEQFRALAQQIAAAITIELSGAVAADVLPDLLAAVRAGELATCRAVERVDRTGEFGSDGAASTAAYLRNVSGEANAWCSERVALGRALADRMPATAAAWQSGELGLEHATVIRKATTGLDQELRGEIEKVLAEAAPHITPGDLADLAKRVKAEAAPDEADKAAAKNRDNQRLNVSKTFDGMVRIDGWLDTEAGAEVTAALAAFTRKRDPNLPLGDDPIGKRRAEALHALARQALNHADQCTGSGTSAGGVVPASRHSLIVALSLEALQTGLGAADIQGHGTITAAAARRLACDMGIIPAVLGTNSEILDLGSRNRLATPSQRRNIGLRDGGCLWPGCDRPPAACEAHHRTHHIDGGPTKEKNLDSYCTFHHHLVHEGGWTYTIIDATTLHFFPPNGGPHLVGKRRPLLGQTLDQRLKPEPTVRRDPPRRT